MGTFCIIQMLLHAVADQAQVFFNSSLLLLNQTVIRQKLIKFS